MQQTVMSLGTPPSGAVPSCDIDLFDEAVIAEPYDHYRAIRDAGGVADLRLYSNLIHEFVSLPGMMDTTIGDAVAFFQRTAVGKPAFDTALGELRKWWETVLARPAQQ